jgi:rod shape-determining protein MreC
MRNLIVFLARHYFFLLFLVLQIISLTLVVNHNYFQRAAAVSASNALVGSMYETRNEVTQYFDLKDQNIQLSEMNAILLGKLENAYLNYDTTSAGVNDSVKLGEKVLRLRYTYIAAQVLDNTVSLRNNYIILNRGLKQGVKPDMGVITPGGIVGIVREVSDNFCVVMSLLHKDSKVSASVKRDGTFGQLSWNFLDYRQGEMVDLPTHSKIAVGDTLVTSGLSESYPAGIPVGVVMHFERKGGDKTYTVRVKYTTDFRKLHHVYIVRDLMSDEINQLKEKAGVNDAN